MVNADVDVLLIPARLNQHAEQSDQSSTPELE